MKKEIAHSSQEAQEQLSCDQQAMNKEDTTYSVYKDRLPNNDSIHNQDMDELPNADEEE